MDFIVVLAGIALSAAAIIRLSGRGLGRMPRLLAVGVAGVSAAVVALGVTGLLSEPKAIRRKIPLASASARTDKSGPASISGIVTSTGGPVRGQSVALSQFEATEITSSRTTQTDQQGLFSFVELTTSPTTAYVVVAEFGGARFSTDIMVLDPGITKQVDIEVAQPTTDSGVIRILTDSAVLVGDRRGTQVLQIITLENSSDKAFAGQLLLPFIAGGGDLIPKRGLNRPDLEFGDNGLISTTPVLPGRHEIVYDYLAPPAVKPTNIRFRLAYPTEQLEILWGGKLVLTSPTLRRAAAVVPPIETGNGKFERLEASDLEPGNSVQATMRIKPDDQSFAVIALVVAGLAAGSVLIFGILRRAK